MNTGLMLLGTTRLAAGLFTVLVRSVLFTRKIQCPKCGDHDEVPALFITCRCQHCGCVFDLLVGRVRHPRSLAKRIFDHLFTWAGVVIFAVFVLLLVARYLTTNPWVLAGLALLLLTPWSWRPRAAGYPFGTEHHAGTQPPDDVTDIKRLAGE